MSGIPTVPPLAALTLFAAWAMVLVLSIGAWRLGHHICRARTPDCANCRLNRVCPRNGVRTPHFTHDSNTMNAFDKR